MNYWSLASAASKWLVLLAAAGVSGGVFSLWLAAHLRMAPQAGITRYVVSSAVLGVCAACGFLLVQIGAINQAGVGGMFDPGMGGILAQAPLGHAAVLKAAAFACIVLALALLRGPARVVLLTASIAALAFSFALTGHVSTLSYAARAGIVLHILAALLWVGALYPLLLLSAAAELADVRRLMLLFGELAVYGVAVLLASGIVLLAQTIGSPGALFNTAYGQAFIGKLGAVALLLALAAGNKLLLVPQLNSNASTRRLRLSIATEVLVACFVLAITAWLTTVVGPAH